MFGSFFKSFTEKLYPVNDVLINIFKFVPIKDNTYNIEELIEEMKQKEKICLKNVRMDIVKLKEKFGKNILNIININDILIENFEIIFTKALKFEINLDGIYLDVWMNEKIRDSDKDKKDKDELKSSNSSNSLSISTLMPLINLFSDNISIRLKNIYILFKNYSISIRKISYGNPEFFKPLSIDKRNKYIFFHGKNIEIDGILIREENILSNSSASIPNFNTPFFIRNNSKIPYYIEDNNIMIFDNEIIFKIEHNIENNILFLHGESKKSLIETVFSGKQMQNMIQFFKKIIGMLRNINENLRKDNNNNIKVIDNNNNKTNKDNFDDNEGYIEILGKKLNGIELKTKFDFGYCVSYMDNELTPSIPKFFLLFSEYMNKYYSQIYDFFDLQKLVEKHYIYYMKPYILLSLSNINIGFSYKNKYLYNIVDIEKICLNIVSVKKINPNKSLIILNNNNNNINKDPTEEQQFDSLFFPYFSEIIKYDNNIINILDIYNVNVENNIGKIEKIIGNIEGNILRYFISFYKEIFYGNDDIYNNKNLDNNNSYNTNDNECKIIEDFKSNKECINTKENESNIITEKKNYNDIDNNTCNIKDRNNANDLYNFQISYISIRIYMSKKWVKNIKENVYKNMHSKSNLICIFDNEKYSEFFEISLSDFNLNYYKNPYDFNIKLSKFLYLFHMGNIIYPIIYVEQKDNINIRKINIDNSNNNNKNINNIDNNIINISININNNIDNRIKNDKSIDNKAFILRGTFDNICIFINPILYTNVYNYWKLILENLYWIRDYMKELGIVKDNNKNNVKQPIANIKFPKISFLFFSSFSNYSNIVNLHKKPENLFSLVKNPFSKILIEDINLSFTKTKNNIKISIKQICFYIKKSNDFSGNVLNYSDFVDNNNNRNFEEIIKIDGGENNEINNDVINKNCENNINDQIETICDKQNDNICCLVEFNTSNSHLSLCLYNITINLLTKNYIDIYNIIEKAKIEYKKVHKYLYIHFPMNNEKSDIALYENYCRKNKLIINQNSNSTEIKSLSLIIPRITANLLYQKICLISHIKNSQFLYEIKKKVVDFYIKKCDITLKNQCNNEKIMKNNDNIKYQFIPIFSLSDLYISNSINNNKNNKYSINDVNNGEHTQNIYNICGEGYNTIKSDITNIDKIQKNDKNINTNISDVNYSTYIYIKISYILLKFSPYLIDNLFKLCMFFKEKSHIISSYFDIIQDDTESFITDIENINEYRKDILSKDSLSIDYKSENTFTGIRKNIKYNTIFDDKSYNNNFSKLYDRNNIYEINKEEFGKITADILNFSITLSEKDTPSNNSELSNFMNEHQGQLIASEMTYNNIEENTIKLIVNNIKFDTEFYYARKKIFDIILIVKNIKIEDNIKNSKYKTMFSVCDFEKENEIELINIKSEVNRMDIDNGESMVDFDIDIKPISIYLDRVTLEFFVNFINSVDTFNSIINEDKEESENDEEKSENNNEKNEQIIQQKVYNNEIIDCSSINYNIYNNKFRISFNRKSFFIRKLHISPFFFSINYNVNSAVKNRINDIKYINYMLSLKELQINMEEYNKKDIILKNFKDSFKNVYEHYLEGLKDYPEIYCKLLKSLPILSSMSSAFGGFLDIAREPIGSIKNNGDLGEGIVRGARSFSVKLASFGLDILDFCSGIFSNFCCGYRGKESFCREAVYGINDREKKLKEFYYK